MSDQWYYAQGSEQRGPMTLAALRGLARSGQVARDTLVWGPGLTDWLPMSDVPELATAPASTSIALTPAPGRVGQVPVAKSIAYATPYTGDVFMTERAMDMLRQTRPWVMLFAILLWIAVGLMAIFGFFGLLAVVVSIGTANPSAGLGAGVVMLLFAAISLLYIMPALYLTRYASRIGQLQTMRRPDLLEQALESQKSFWKFFGVLTLIMIAINLLVGVSSGLLGFLL